MVLLDFFQKFYFIQLRILATFEMNCKVFFGSAIDEHCDQNIVEEPMFQLSRIQTTKKVTIRLDIAC